MLIQISEIKINAGRREARAGSIKELADSISEVGLLNPITVDCGHTLIAGLHRLEAAKLLGWTEIECTVCDLEGLQAELAEIDENVVRADLSPVDYGDLLLRRKSIYEELHPESKATYDGGEFRGNQYQRVVDEKFSPTKSFVQDTAEKLGVTPRTVETQVQMAKNLTPEAKEILRETGVKVTKQSVKKISQLKPEQQVEAASQLVAGDIKSVDEYQPPPAKEEPLSPSQRFAPPPTVPYSISGKHFATFEESVADLKNHDKDCSYTADGLLAELDSFIQKFHREFEWYSDPFCTVVFPDISQVQFDYLKQRLGTISTATQELLQQIKRSRKS